MSVSLIDWYRVYHAEKARLLAQYASVKTAKILAATRANRDVAHDENRAS